MTKSNKKKQKKSFGKHPNKKYIEKTISKKYVKFLCLSAIFILTVIVFSSSINNEFLTNWDDQDYVTNNNDIKDLSYQNVKKIFTSYYVANYQPVTMLSYGIEYKFFNLNPKTFHTTNLILHLLNIILVFQLIYLLTRKTGISAIAALFFAIHPMHVESVAWISERKDVLYSLFYLGALIAYIYYIKNKKNKYLIYSLLLFIFSLLSKSMAVTMPVVLILFDYYYKRKFERKIIIEKIPFFILAICFGIIAILSQKSGGGIYEIPLFTSFDRIFIVSYAIIFYIVKMFLPFNLSELYYYPVKTNGLLPVEYYIASVIILLIIFLILRINKTNKMKKDLIFGLMFFLITISLVLQIIPVGRAIIAERYTYIPYIGLFFIIGQYYTLVNSKKNSNKAIKTKFYLYTVLIVYIIFFSYTTYNRNKVWKNGITLFSDVVKKYPSKPFGYWACGIAKNNAQDFKGAITDYTKAIELTHCSEAFINKGEIKNDLHLYKKTIQNNHSMAVELVDCATIYYNRGVSKSILKNYKQSLEDYNKAIELNPDYAEAYNNCGIVKGILQDYQGSIKDFGKAIALNPNYTEAYNNQGITKSNLKDYQGAIKDFDKAIALNPNYAEAYNNRGNAKKTLQKYRQALKDYNKSIELNPDNPMTLYIRGNLKIELKDYKRAIKDFDKAIALNPNYVAAFINRGLAKYYLQKYQEAIKDYNKSIEINPNNANAYYNLGFSKLKLNMKIKACQDWKKAYQLGYTQADKMIKTYCK